MSLKVLTVCVTIIFLLIESISSDDIELMRIFNGDRTTIEEFPHTVYINKNENHHCGGSILSEDIVLTAAHCFTDTNIDDLTISVGTSDCIEVIDEFKLERFIIHEKFVEDNLKNDIAVIKLKRPLRFRKNVQPIKLVRPGEDIPQGKVVRTAGCGTIDERGVSRDAKKLLSATLRALSEEECADLEPKFNAESLICLRDDKEHKSVCHGDSGSGFLVDGKLAGVVSYGPKVCGESPLSGATKVSMYISWIDDTIKKMGGKPATVYGSKPLDGPQEKDLAPPNNNDSDEKKKEQAIKELEKENKKIVKTKLSLNGNSEEDYGSSSEESNESGPESGESDKEYGHRIINVHEKRIGDMMRSINQMLSRVKMMKKDRDLAGITTFAMR